MTFFRCNSRVLIEKLVERFLMTLGSHCYENRWSPLCGVTTTKKFSELYALRLFDTVLKFILNFLCVGTLSASFYAASVSF